jgi:hypothetical protein
MSRIRMLPMREAGWFTRLADWGLRRQQGGRSPTAAAIYGHNPAVLFSLIGFGAGYLRWKALPARLKRLVHLRTAMRVGCPS